MKIFIVTENLINFYNQQHLCRNAKVYTIKADAYDVMSNLYYSHREKNDLNFGSDRVNCDVRIDNLHQIDYDNYMRYSVQIDEVEL